MKRVYVNEEWCLGCHLCEYNCAYANSGLDDMVKALKGKPIFPRVHVEDDGEIHIQHYTCDLSTLGLPIISEYDIEASDY